MRRTTIVLLVVLGATVVPSSAPASAPRTAPAARTASAPRTAPAPPALVTDGRDPGPVDVASTSLVQRGPQLVWTVQTRGSWSSAALRGGAGRRICLSVSRHGQEAHRACVVRRGSGLALRATDVGADGRPESWRATDAVVSRSGARLTVAGAPRDLSGRAVGPLRWYATTTWEGGTACPAGSPCEDRAPRSGQASYLVRTAVQAGCVAAGPTLVTHGPAASHDVALTFDDGPFTLTSAFLDELERLHVPATFFLIGRQIAPQAGLLRRMVRDGDALGNHTWDHRDISGGGLEEITSTNAAIERAVGFAPCLMRPPGGGRSAALDAQIGSLGMIETLWSIDTDDWKLPGTAAVVSRASAATAGSIVLMHDGGGPRGGTLAALPSIVRNLRAKGLTPVTVPELLGLRPRWHYR